MLLLLLACVASGTTWVEVASPALDADQQLALERLNRVRSDPPSCVDDFEALFEEEEARSPRQCDDSLRSTVGPLRKAESRPPLAPVSALVEVAEAHATAMATGGWFNHVDPQGIGPNERLRRAGVALDVRVPSDGRVYLYGAGQRDNQVESLYSRSAFTTGEVGDPELHEWSSGIDSLIVDRCVNGRGHRDHVLGRTVLSEQDREVGIGTATALAQHPTDPRFGGWTLRLVVLTRARLEGDFFLVGSVFSDKDGDGRYSAGEGLGDVLVELAELSIRTRTAPGGGFVIPVPDGTRGTLSAQTTSVEVEVSGANLSVPLPL
ncbi:MAG TPA: hypothetical protein QGF58_03220 [Myxococcota bacterium]|nr:hypothetical protein [Myxococcota bacterium]